MTDKQIKLASKMYLSGESADDIAVKLRLSSGEVVRYWLKKNDVPMRIPGHRRGIKHEPNADTEAIKDMRLKGCTFEEIGKQFGLSKKAVQARLAYHNIS